MSMTSWVKSQAQNDEADSVLVSVVLIFPFIILMLGWSVDFSKNVVVRSDYDEIALEAAQAAIRNQDGVGNVDCAGDTGRNGTDWLTYSQAKSRLVEGTTAYQNTGPAVRQALRSYLQKTGRAVPGNLYTDDANADDYDAQQVKTYRAFVNGGKDADSGSLAFLIKVSCGTAADRSGAGASRGQVKSSGEAAKIDMVTVSVKDWTGNFFLANPLFSNYNNRKADSETSDVIHNTGAPLNVQRYNIEQRAISSWSESALNTK